jgi:N-acetylneuraminic acid mutarotase
MPTAREHLSSATVNGKLYVIGGRVLSLTRNLSVVEEYDPSTDSWITKSLMPTPRGGLAAATIGTDIYVFGGETPDIAFTTNEIYSVTSNTWRKGLDMPFPRHGLGAVAIKNQIFILGGGTTPGLSYTNFNQVLVTL